MDAHFAAADMRSSRDRKHEHGVLDQQGVNNLTPKTQPRKYFGKLDRANEQYLSRLRATTLAAQLG